MGSIRAEATHRSQSSWDMSPTLRFTFRVATACYPRNAIDVHMGRRVFGNFWQRCLKTSGHRLWICVGVRLRLRDLGSPYGTAYLYEWEHNLNGAHFFRGLKACSTFTLPSPSLLLEQVSG